MRSVLFIALLALTGCASWFRSDPPKVETPVVHAAPEVKLWAPIPTITQFDAAKGYLQQAAQAKDESAYRRSIDLAERSAAIARADADASAARASKAQALADIVAYCVWAIGIGILVYIGANVPFLAPFLGPLRSAAGATVMLAAAVAIGAPWLSDLLGHKAVLWAAYASFAILAISAALAGAWWLFDKARDAVNRD